MVALTPLMGKDDHNIEDYPAALEAVLNLPGEGVLVQKENGFVYLDVDNAFITESVSLIDCPGLLRPLPTSSRSLGAHISVFYEKEGISPIELGQRFSFDVTDIRSFTMHTRDGDKRQWVIAVDSPELEQLRQSYGLKPLLKGHAYHISLGKQIPTGVSGWEERDELSVLDAMDSDVESLYDLGDFTTLPSDCLDELLPSRHGLGKLKVKGNGFVYLDVDDMYIEDLAPALPVQSEFKPLSTGGKKMGAHISVIHEDEMISKQIWDLAEAGESFLFEVKELRYVDRKQADGLSRLWLLAVDAPGLQRLRTQYGLKPKLQNHDFHITLGSEKAQDDPVFVPDEDLAELFRLPRAA